MTRCFRHLAFFQMPQILIGQTIWGARGRRHTYVITQDIADGMRFSVSAKNVRTGKNVMHEFSIYTSLTDAEAECNAIENGRRH